MNKVIIFGLCHVVLNTVLASQPAISAEVTLYDDGPLKGKGLPFSESVRVGDLLFLSGVVAMDTNGKLVSGGIDAEAKQIFSNISAVLERRGLSLTSVVKCTVFLADIAEWPTFNEVYKQYFKAPYPARSALAASGLALNARAEVECIAAYQ